jgi:uncharacterized lipoprotein YmbA
LTPPFEPASPASTAPSPAARIVVRRVLVPDYLDTTDILLRIGNNQVKARATARWGERLSQGLTHALAADLVARMPSDSIVTDVAGPTRQLLITVNALDLWPDGRCAIAASWSLVEQGASRTVASGSGMFESPAMGSAIGLDDARLVDAVSHTLDELANAIAVNVRQSFPTAH